MALRVPLLLLGFLLPSVVTWIYFHGGAGTVFSQAVYSGSKVFLLALPILWICWLDRERPRLPRPTVHALRGGLVSGLAMGALLLNAYYFGLRGADFLGEAAGEIHAKLAEFGIADRGRFLAFSVFVVLANASIEEYFWRGFIHKRLAERMRWPAAAVVSGIGFSLHHIVVLDAYFPLGAALLFSAGVAVGGMIWAWLYRRCGSIYAPWLSHAVVDVAVYIIAFDLLF